MCTCTDAGMHVLVPVHGLINSSSKGMYGLKSKNLVSPKRFSGFKCITAWQEIIQNCRGCFQSKYLTTLPVSSHFSAISYQIWVQKIIKQAINTSISKYEMNRGVVRKSSVRTPQIIHHIRQRLTESQGICKMSLSISEKNFSNRLRLDHTLKMQCCAH